MKNYGMFIDLQYCTGCHSCEVACQQENHYDVEQFGIQVTEYIVKKKSGVVIDYVPYVTDLCHFCLGRLKEGNRPLCAKSCMSQCMFVGPIDEVIEHAKDGKKPVVYMK
ncbi:MAG: oxidoreductase [Oscillospiraceae bacterium]|nr:oxidoreductase [Oscillospiraceae bacterium]